MIRPMNSSNASASLLGETTPISRMENAEQIETSITAIKVHDFCAYYNKFQVIHQVNLEINAHQVTALIGPSGCGKSTFLRWVNRMNDLVPGAWAHGTLTLFNQSVLSSTVDVVDLRRRVGMVFQKPNPFPKSIYENVAFGPNLHFKMSRRDLDGLV